MSTEQHVFTDETDDVDVLSICSEAIESDNRDLIKELLPKIQMNDVAYLADYAARHRHASACFSLLTDVLFQSNRKLSYLVPVMSECAVHDNVEHLRQNIAKIDINSPSFIKVFLSAMRSDAENVYRFLCEISPPHVLSTVCTAAIQSQHDKMIKLLFPLVHTDDIPGIISMALHESHSFDEQKMEYLERFISDLPRPIFLDVYRTNHLYIKDKEMKMVLARHQKEILMKNLPAQEMKSKSVKTRRM